VHSQETGKPRTLGLKTLFIAIVLLVCALILSSCTRQTAPAGSNRSEQALQAGVARIDITPDFPVALEGYLNPETRISTGVHDRLFVRAIAFSNGPRRLVVVSCDLGGFLFSDYFRYAILEAFKLRHDELFLCATHTHSGPALSLNRSYPHPNNFKFTENLKAALLKAVAESLKNLTPARIGMGKSTSSIGVNRRLILPNGEVRMAPNPGGPSDPEVLVMQITDVIGRPAAALFDYACHSRSLNRNNTLVSGDIFGIAEQTVEDAFGKRFICSALSGASGDIDPMRVVSGFDEGPDRISETGRMGSSLGAAVVSGLKKLHYPPDQGQIMSLSRRVMLPSKTAGRMRPIELIAARVGEVAFLGLNCEALVEVGNAIKAASPFPYLFMITNCNGWAGYLPPGRMYKEGGYEVNQSGFGPEAADILVSQAGELLVELRKQP
jgi:hypothetical protein